MHRDAEKPDGVIITSLYRLFDDIRAFYVDSPLIQRDLDRDRLTITNRVKHEGIAFLEVALPSLGDAYLRMIDTRTYTPPRGFSAKRPELFRWAFRGYVVDWKLETFPPPDVVTHILQLCFFFKKILRPVRDDHASSETVKFLGRNSLAWSLPDLSKAREFIHNLYSDYDKDLLLPGHGPGAVFERTRHHKSLNFRLCFQSEVVFPAKQWLFHSDGLRYTADVLRPKAHYSSRMVFVPKTAKGPRAIAIEETNAQFLQQGIMRYMMSRLKRSGTDLRDQSRMHLLASQHNATIDFSAASDSISVRLVESLFPQDLLEALLATRSMTCVTELGEVNLSIYATMGNATCFPVLTTVLLGLLHQSGTRGHAYGDDIIVEGCPSAFLSLASACGFVLNEKKSFFSDSLSESCGRYFYFDKDVTPAYLRQPSVSGPQGLVGLSSTSDQLYDRFYLRAAQHLADVVERVIGPLPVTKSSRGYLSKVSARAPRELLPKIVRYRRSSSSFLFRGWLVRNDASNLSYNEIDALHLTLIRPSFNGFRAKARPTIKLVRKLVSDAF